VRDPDRINGIIESLKTLWMKYPDMRLGQLLENYVFYRGIRGDKTSVALFYQEDYKTTLAIDTALSLADKEAKP
jgi:uncharacterized protein YihD (DUF1040 family)